MKVILQVDGKAMKTTDDIFDSILGWSGTPVVLEIQNSQGWRGEISLIRKVSPLLMSIGAISGSDSTDLSRQIGGGDGGGGGILLSQGSAKNMLSQFSSKNVLRQGVEKNTTQHAGRNWDKLRASVKHQDPPQYSNQYGSFKSAGASEGQTRCV